MESTGRATRWHYIDRACSSVFRDAANEAVGGFRRPRSRLVCLTARCTKDEAGPGGRRDQGPIRPGRRVAAIAARFAGYIASETGARLTLLHVYDAPTVAALGLASLSKEEVKETVERVAQGSFRAASEELAAFDVPVETRALVGHPAQEIVAYAREHHPQLIVMGTRGLSPLKERVLGSVADHVTRHAPCPVTIHR